MTSPNSTDKSETPLACHNGHDGAAAAAAEGVAAPPLATMLTRHLIRDGELILLTLKPSVWYILFSSLRFLAIVLIVMIGVQIFEYQTPYRARVFIEVGILLIAGRVMWAILMWMSRLYILTDMRILILSGVFTADIFDCPLRKVGRTRIVRTMKDRPLNLGSIEIIPFDENFPIGMWQTIPNPKDVHQQILAAISRAKQGPSL